MRQVIRCADQVLRQSRCGECILIGQVEPTERAPDRFKSVRPRALIDRDADAVIADLAQVDSVVDGVLHDQSLVGSDLNRDGVEIGRRADLEPQRRETFIQPDRVTVNAFGDRFQPARPVKYGVHGRDDGQQDLRRTDIRRRLFAADMLLARLQCEAIGAVALGVHRNTDEPAGHRALMSIPRRHVGGVRPAIPHRHTVALHGPDGDVGTHFTGRLQQRQRQRIGGNHGNRAGGMELRDGFGEVVTVAVDARILEQGAENLRRIEIGKRVADHDAPAERLSARFYDCNRLRQAVAVDKECFGLQSCDAVRHGHRLGPGCGFVEQ